MVDEYAPKGHWDREFRRRLETGDDLDWGEQWTGPFLGPLRLAGARRILDLGCGTGNDVKRLAGAGFRAIGMDFSRQAVAQAAAKLKGPALVLAADMSAALPFADGSFEAVMSNVALHMFPDRITREIFREVRRIVAPGGLFLFHVNASEDRSLRARRRPPVRELEPGFILEQDGQTMRFFSREYLEELLAPWAEVELQAVEIADRETGEPFKRVWRGVARR